MPIQLPLHISLSEDRSLENFVAGDNRELLDSLISGDEWYIYFWGNSHTGKSHLLQAMYHREVNQGKQAFYLPMRQILDTSPELLDGLEQASLICIDDIEVISGHAGWEEAVFRLFNGLKEMEGRLLIASNAPHRQIGVKLKDLKSRLSWGVSYHLSELSDMGKVKLLCGRSAERGFELSEESANYLLRHAPRDMNFLLQFLEKIDYASLAEQRRLTIPFIKKCLAGFKFHAVNSETEPG